jgi:Arc/MetJ-type ribon-helix-helix transcriptional regulator
VPVGTAATAAIYAATALEKYGDPIDTRRGPAARLRSKRMDVQLTPDQQAIVRYAIESGRLTRPEEAVQEALALWERRERTRLELLASLDDADAALARGEGRAITAESMRQLGDEVHQRGLARLAAEPSATQ